MTNLQRRIRCAGLALVLVVPVACQQEMGRQPYYRPFEPSPFFPDGRSARPLQPGTVAQGQLQDDLPTYTGKMGPRADLTRALLAGSLVGRGIDGPWLTALVIEPLLENLAVSEYAVAFPLPITTAVLERGQQRFTIYCSVCHDLTGNGNGKIVQRGYTRPPSYITDYSRGFAHRGIKVLLRDVPVGYLFEVASKGYGAMPDYATQVPVRDRWAIVAYIRALQLSQHARLDALPDADRRAVQQALEGKP